MCCPLPLLPVWMSSTQGKDWSRQGSIPFDTAGGRFSASLLITHSKLLRKDVMLYIGGYSRVPGQDRYHKRMRADSLRALLLWLSSVGVVVCWQELDAADGSGAVCGEGQLQR
jgi:hypothetical protein